MEQAGLEPAARDQLLRRADRAIGETKQYIDENQPRLDLAEKNNNTRQEVDRERRVKQETKEKIAHKLDEFNRLRDEQRYEEAQIAAKQAAELDPNDPVAQQLLTDAKFLYRVMSNNALRDKKEEGFWTGHEFSGRIQRAFQRSTSLCYARRQNMGRTDQEPGETDASRAPPQSDRAGN